MRRWLLLALVSASSALGAMAGCSSFTSDGSDVSDASAQEADVATEPSSCAPAPTAEPCTTACTAKLPLLPASVAKPGSVGDARIAVKDGTIYVARVVDGARVELFTYDGTSPSWALRGSYPGSAVYGLAVNDTTVLVSLRHPAPPSPTDGGADGGGDGGADGGAPSHVIVAVEASCPASCVGTPTTVPGSSAAGAGVVAIGPNFYFSAEKAVMTLKNGQLVTIAPMFGAPVVAADCAYVYWSNVFDDIVHRYDDATGITEPVGTGTVVDSGFDGPFPGTVSLATTDDSVVAATGSGHLYTMPKAPTHSATVIVDQPGVGPIVADGRFVYYARPASPFFYDLVRVLPDGGAPTTLSVGALRVAGMASDGDHVYVVEASGDVTRIAK